MEHAGTAVAAAVRALAIDTRPLGDRPDRHPVRPRQQRRRRLRGGPPAGPGRCPVIVALVATEARPRAADAAPQLGSHRARRAASTRSTPRSPATSRCSGRGSRRPRSSSTPCSGPAFVARSASRSARPSRSSTRRGRPACPIVAVDTPTAVDLSSGEPSEPAVRADLTVTFHRPKTGLRPRVGVRAYAGKVLVAPIGIPPEADRG